MDSVGEKTRLLSIKRQLEQQLDEVRAQGGLNKGTQVWHLTNEIHDIDFKLQRLSTRGSNGGSAGLAGVWTGPSASASGGAFGLPGFGSHGPSRGGFGMQNSNSFHTSSVPGFGFDASGRFGALAAKDSAQGRAGSAFAAPSSVPDVGDAFPPRGMFGAAGGASAASTHHHPPSVSSASANPALKRGVAALVASTQDPDEGSARKLTSKHKGSFGTGGSIDSFNATAFRGEGADEESLNVELVLITGNLTIRKEAMKKNKGELSRIEQAIYRQKKRVNFLRNLRPLLQGKSRKSPSWKLESENLNTVTQADWRMQMTLRGSTGIMMR
jgi:hypothetical protein